MVSVLLVTCILGQNSNIRPALKPCALSAPYAAVFDKLAGHGFAGNEVIVELDPKDYRHWKAAVLFTRLDYLLIPIAEQIVTKDQPDFHLLQFGKHVSDQVGALGKETDRKAWTHAKFALPKADNLDLRSRIDFIILRMVSGDLSDAILANHEVDVFDGLVLSINPSRGQDNLIPIGRDGTVTRVLRSCLGGAEIAAFETPGFPK